MASITIKVEIWEENIQAVIDHYEGCTGKKPSKRWLMNFLRLDIAGLVNETFTDGIEDAIEACIEAKDFQD